MSSSDARLFADLTARVSELETSLAALSSRVAVLEETRGKDLHGDLYGAPVDHTADREERAELRRGPGRPPGPR